jgi:hypothetical protein
MPRAADPRPVVIALAFACALSRSVSAAQVPLSPETLPEPASTDSTLRTFIIKKPIEPVQKPAPSTASFDRYRMPRGHDALRATIGIGYVQGADWGTEINAAGGFAGTQVQLNSLFTSGREGFVVDQGSLSVFDPDAQWRVEAGDLFSQLRGASRGVRFSLPTANALRRPAVAVYGPGRGSRRQGTVVSYRDQLQIGRQTLLDAEFASDKSFFLRNRLLVGGLDVESAYRSYRRPAPTSDASLSAGITIWHGVGLNAGIYQELGSGDRNQWRTIALRLPITRYFDLTLERSHAGTRDSSHTVSAAMGSVTAGQLRLFHRMQVGEYEFGRDALGTIERQQSQSVASYNAGARLNVMLQLATQRMDTGQVQHWEEMQTSVRVTSSTLLRVVTAVPDIKDAARWRGYFRQGLPGRFAVQADYGRLSAFQTIPNELDRSRFKVMLFRTWDLATPARGGTVTGRVIDDAGRAVPGAGVKLGPYTTESDARGTYTFRYVPAGAYDLGLDRNSLPADVAWDGRDERLTVSASTRASADLRVAPLNAIHGRVYCDENDNGRFDRGEGVAGAILHLGDRSTSTDHDGAYTFSNSWPSTYVVTLDATRMGKDFGVVGPAAVTVTLTDDGPVTGADFRVAKKSKPIIWTTPAR